VTSAKEIVAPDSSANALEWAAEVLQVRFDEVLILRDNALNSADIEGVHQMRVAIRRLRSALRDFSPLMKSQLLNRSRKELKRLADTLGNARDQDVALAALEKLRDRAKREKIKQEIEKKLEKRRNVREATQHELEKILNESSLNGLKEDFSKAIDDAVRKNKKLSELTAREAGREVISNGLQEFCDLSASLYDPFNCEKLHELRISAKRLRYAIELFTICWGEQISPFAKEITEMQTALGELHDSDIWIENLSRRLSKEKGKKRSADFWLLSKFIRNRTKHYRVALRLWSRWQKTKFIKRLRLVLAG